MIKYWIIEVAFTSNKWERIGERFSHLHKAVEEMERIDLTFPTRISKITKQVVLQEKTHGKSANKRDKTAYSKHKGMGRKF